MWCAFVELDANNRFDACPGQDAHNDNQTIYCQFEVYKINLAVFSYSFHYLAIFIPEVCTPTKGKNEP